MNKLTMTLLLGALALNGTWARAQQAEQPAPQAVQAGSEAGVIEVQGAGGRAPVAGGGTANLQAIAPLAALLSADGQTLAVPAPRARPIPNVRAQVNALGNGSAWISSARATLPGKAEKTAFLGVVTTRADATLRSQLKLKAGLVVDSVEPKSSAAVAGLQVHDIIEKCDDQWLINPAQFIGLVRMYYKKGETVTLTVIREGERKKITAKLEERDTYAVDDDGKAIYSFFGSDGDKPGGSSSAFFVGPAAGYPAGPLQRMTADALGAAPLAPGFMVSFGDDKQQLLINLRDGHRVLTVNNPAGKQVFQGPIDTPDQWKQVPETVRKKLQEMEKIKLKIRAELV